MKSSLLLAALLQAVTTCLLVSYPQAVLAADINPERMALERRYMTPHSLGDNYVFNSRDGWQTVNTSNLLYKYQSRATILDDSVDEKDVELDDTNPLHTGKTELAETGKPDSYTSGTAGEFLPDTVGEGDTYPYGTDRMKLLPRTHKGLAKLKNAHKHKSNVLGNASNGLLSSVRKIINTIKGKGKPEPVVITWYTGHDLENPSCWANPSWAPTDNSFAAALTLVGWEAKPKCFKFLELCNSPQKCVFVRVVDSCAGCAADSKHVDLTKAAFQSLADLDQGLLTVQMREATDPEDGWLEELWGPKMGVNN